jgi:hypothetical protein
MRLPHGEIYRGLGVESDLSPDLSTPSLFLLPSSSLYPPLPPPPRLQYTFFFPPPPFSSPWPSILPFSPLLDIISNLHLTIDAC